MKTIKLLFTISILIFTSCNAELTTQEKAEQLVYNYLMDNLKDPDSYQSVSFDVIKESQSDEYDIYSITHKYRAKNGFGGYNFVEKTFYINGKMDAIIDAYGDNQLVLEFFKLNKVKK